MRTLSQPSSNPDATADRPAGMAPAAANPGFIWRLWALAWRNLWRNRRRTWLTISGIAFAVWFLIFARSMQTGTFDLMIDNGARLLPGHLQIQHVDYQDEPLVANTFAVAAVLANPQLQTPAPTSAINAAAINRAAPAGLSHLSARAQGFALISVGERSFGAQVIGVEPQVEAQWSSLATLMRSGRYLENPGEAVMGTVLARNLGLESGSEFVILGTAREGGIAAMAARLVGVFETGSNELNRGVLQVHIDDFRDAWAMSADEAHMLVGVAASVTTSEHIARQLAHALPELAVLDWAELMPEAQQTREMKAVSTELLFYVIAIIVGFSVVTTFMMMVFERTQEMGVMIAIGMRPAFIRLQLQLEALYVALFGVAIGASIALTLNLLLQDQGIPVPVDMTELYERFNMPARIYPAFAWQAMYTASLLMLVGVQLAAFIPGMRVGRLSPVEAIRQEA